MATIKDVAKLAGVSVATVSRVINNTSRVTPETREAVIKAQDELNYHPVISPKLNSRQDSELVGMSIADHSDPYFGQMVKAVDQSATKEGMSLIVNAGYHDAERERQCIEELIQKRCRIIIAHTVLLRDDVLTRYMANQKSMILINRKLPGFEERCVYLDDEGGAYLAVKHLIQNGHSKIAYIRSSHPITDADMRFRGYVRALEEAGIAFNPALVVSADPTPQGGEQGAEALLNLSQQFTAIACYNDMQAAGAMAILSDNDIRIPEHVSIIGFDNTAISRYLHPRLTTIMNPVSAMAMSAFAIGLAIIREQDTQVQSRVFTPTLIKRFSVRDLRAF
ncbi:substrate-binding domain-containing protein [Succinimonas amylolytica]|uniref:substrate-binding domain-containing protein n=1 Tax=Succinimonas amylolytica TaxID=83769 RepID=UPI0023A8387D